MSSAGGRQPSTEEEIRASWKLNGPQTTADLVVPQLEQFVQHTPGLQFLQQAVRKIASSFAMTRPTNEIVEAGAGTSQLPIEIFYCRMPPSLFAAIPRALWNFSCGTFFGPMLLVGCVMRGIVREGPVKAIKAAGEGVVFGGLWMGLGYSTTATQLLGGTFNTATRPYWQYAQMQLWHPVHREFVTPTMEPDSRLNMMPSDGELWEAAMARMKRQVDMSPAARGPKRGRELYRVLGVSDEATQLEIKSAYRRESMRVHPDRNPSPNAQQQFEDLTRAYRILGDPTQRKKYDAGGEEALKDGSSIANPDRRDTLRSIFGGDKLRDLVGEVRCSRMSRRLIDKVHYNVEESAIMTMRSRDRAAETLLSYLASHPGPSPALATTATATAGASTSSSSTAVVDKAAMNKYDAAFKAWEQQARKRLNESINVGLAKEVLHVIGNQYHDVLDEAALSPVQRLGKAAVQTPSRAAARIIPVLKLVKNGGKVIKDPSVVLENVWSFSVAELQATARYAATRVLLDTTATPEECARRRAALLDFARLVVKSGKPWDGANESVMKTLQQTASSDMRRRQQEKEKQQRK